MSSARRNWLISSILNDCAETRRAPFHGLYDTGAETATLVRARTLPLTRILEAPDNGFYLAEHSGRLTLCHAGEQPERGLWVDFNSADIQRRIAAGRHSALARALGLHKRFGIKVFDATCGLGRESAVLAGLGCTLTAVERHSALYALLADGVRRMDIQPPAWWVNWQDLHHANGRDWLQHDATTDAFDAIYIDPMFDNTRRKARPQRAMQWLEELVGVDDDAQQLLAAARDSAKRRVVVKSHARAAPLARPDHQIAGKAMRFDVYFRASKSSR